MQVQVQVQIHPPTLTRFSSLTLTLQRIDLVTQLRNLLLQLGNHLGEFSHHMIEARTKLFILACKIVDGTRRLA
jgi:hypothetical protein